MKLLFINTMFCLFIFSFPLKAQPLDKIVIPAYISYVEHADSGYYCIKLRGISKNGSQFPSVKSFLISGEAAKGAHFNTQPRRNAASVHLRYPFPEDTKVEWFYNEVTIPQGFDPVSTFYMANGFKRGYFGIQVNSKTERWVIFSVWDSGNEAIDRNKVNDENRVKLLEKGAGVVANDFGNEGIGGHSHWVYPWVTGQTYRFLLHAQPDNGLTTYMEVLFPELPNLAMLSQDL